MSKQKKNKLLKNKFDILLKIYLAKHSKNFLASASEIESKLMNNTNNSKGRNVHFKEKKDLVIIKESEDEVNFKLFSKTSFKAFYSDNSVLDYIDSNAEIFHDLAGKPANSCYSDSDSSIFLSGKGNQICQNHLDSEIFSDKENQKPLKDSDSSKILSACCDKADSGGSNEWEYSGEINEWEYSGEISNEW